MRFDWRGRILVPVRANLASFCRWLMVAAAVGLVVGAAGSAFYYLLHWVTDLRTKHGWLVWLLPFGGLLIVGCYRLSKVETPKGTNLVLAAVRSGEPLPARMAPLIFVSTVLTHLFGGSAGREGAALQLGGSLGTLVGRWLKLDDDCKKIVIMCGMSAGFTALFGTPVAATVFSMEVISVGVMYYAALVPCVVSAVVAYALAGRLGIPPEALSIQTVPAFALSTVLRVLLLGVLCAGISVVMCAAFHQANRLFRQYLPNQYLRAFSGGVLVLLLMLVFQTRDYLGAGMPVIKAAITGQARPEAFLLKILFTAITLGAGFKGGEIVPSFFVGATGGCLIGRMIGLEPGYAAALGMLSVFCGVTNCPITALVLAFEIFGFVSPKGFLLALASSYMLSGYYSLYSAQKIMYSKMRPKYINKPTH